MTKHTPATPLPWHVNASKKGRIIGDETAEGWDALFINGANNTVAKVFRSGDARSLTHAANAYPKLVEALRTVAPIIERFAAEADPQNSVLDQRRDELRALLRELGEDA
jgi:hypothetical protein